jgi:predicted transcriptional regulator
VAKGRRLRSLSQAQIEEIKASSLQASELAMKYGVSATHIARIRPSTLPAWEVLRKLLPHEVVDIRTSQSTNKLLAKKYGVSKSVIQRIKTGETYRNIEV